MGSVIGPAFLCGLIVSAAGSSVFEMLYGHIGRGLLKTFAAGVAVRFDAAFAVALILIAVGCLPVFRKKNPWVAITSAYSLSAGVVALLVAFRTPEFLLYIQETQVLFRSWEFVGAFAMEIGWRIVVAVALCLFMARFLGRRRVSQAGMSIPVNDVSIRPKASSRLQALAFVVCALLNCLWLTLDWHAGWVSRSKPNVVLIIVDTLRSDHVACYAYGRPTTPNIDQLAEDGLLFKNAVSQSSWTRWSISSMLTSRSPEVILPMGDQGLTGHIPFKVGTMAEIFHDLGYATGGIFTGSNTKSSYGFGKGYDSFDDTMSEYDVSSPYVARFAESFLHQTKGKPFFLTLHFIDPHSPYVLHKGYDFDPDYRGPIKSPVTVMQNDALPGITTRDLEFVEAVYDSEIAFTDHYIGAVLNSLKRQGLYDKTLVAVVSDHGEEFRDHGLLGHAHTLYRELTDVVCIVKPPGKSSARQVDEPFPLINLLPSILRTIGYPCDRYGFEGNAWFFGSSSFEDDRPIFSALDCTNELATGKRAISLRSVSAMDHKYIKDILTGKSYMYDHATDPLERKDISSENRFAAACMSKLLSDHMRDCERAKRALNGHGAKAAPVSNEDRARLRSLGYLN